MGHDEHAAAEASSIAATPELRTRASLASDLRALGLERGDTVLVHSSLRSLGWVAGGPVAVVQALLDVLGPNGTLVVPTQTGDNSEPSEWSRPPVPADWWPVLREQLPAFDPAITPSRNMGRIAETVRTWPGAHRSDHPTASFAAIGRLAAGLTRVHDLDCTFGDRSPLGALAEVPSFVLLLGVGWDSCTAFHLAESHVPGLPRKTYGSAVLTAGPDGSRSRAWVTYEGVADDSDDFAELGAELEATASATGALRSPRRGRVGSAECRLVELAAAVRFAEEWIAIHRSVAGSPSGS